MRAATVVQVLHGLFYVLLQLFVVAAIILSFTCFIVCFIVDVIHPLHWRGHGWALVFTATMALEICRNSKSYLGRS